MAGGVEQDRAIPDTLNDGAGCGDLAGEPCRDVDQRQVGRVGPLTAGARGVQDAPIAREPLPWRLTGAEYARVQVRVRVEFSVRSQCQAPPNGDGSSRGSSR